MSRDFLAVELSQSLQLVSRLLTSRARQRIEEDFIITEGGCYAGLGRVIDVLKLITEMKVKQARHANPLTLLPGNVPIQQCLTRLLQQRLEGVVCYVDIDNFKPFNDFYGYAKGDEVLLCLAQCLNAQIDPARDFLGHIGGDDFMLVLRSEDWPGRLDQLMRDFDARCQPLYRSEHLHAGGFVGHNRQGQPERYGLLSLSIGAVRVRPEDGGCIDAGELAALASEAKHVAKAFEGHRLHLTDASPLPQAFQNPNASARAS